MDRRTTEEFLLSIAVPVYNEGQILNAFTDEVVNALKSLDLPGNFEVVFCNDGSTDGTEDKLDDLVARYRGQVRAVHLARNFGQGAALTACLDHVQGNPIIVMDADMQDSPGAFGLFLEKWRAGYAVVYAVRSSREEKAVMQALVWLFYRGLRWLANIDIPLDCGNFGLLDRSVVEALRRLPERNVYFPGLRAWAGFRQTGVKVPRHARYDRKSRVGLRGLWSLAGNALFSFSYVPLLLFRLGAVSAVLLAAFLMGLNWLGIAIPGTGGADVHLFPVLMLLLVSMNLLCVAMVGEYVGRIYDEVKGRPRYIVSRLSGFE